MRLIRNDLRAAKIDRDHPDAAVQAEPSMGASSPRTVVEMLLRLSEREDRGPAFLDDQLHPRALSFAQLVARAQRTALFFQQRGLTPGEHVGLVLPDPLDFVSAFFGAMLIGCIPVPLALPRWGTGSDAYVANAGRILRAARCSALVCDAATTEGARTHWPQLSELVRVVTLADLPETAAGFVPHAPEPSEACFLQFTSGSTATPKGVVVTHGNLVANARGAMLHWLRARPDDVVASWLPLYHDMGLIGCVIAPLLTATPLVILPTVAFIRRPSCWMQTIHDYRATITVAPNFGLALASARAHAATGLDLSCLRVVGCGAEPINPTTLAEFVESHRRFGLAENVISPLYGLAEATLLVTQTPPERAPRSLRLDARAYERERRAVPIGEGERGAAVELVGCGCVIPDHQIEIHSERGAPLPEGQVGEVVVRGPSRTPGYLGEPCPSTAPLYTGDLGFLLDGELFVTGRKKDLVIINGRNLDPQAIEWEVEQVPGVRRGGVVAFSVPGIASEALVLLVEVDSGERERIVSEASQRMSERLGVVPTALQFVPRGSLPKTSSGKLQRAKAREQWLAAHD